MMYMLDMSDDELLRDLRNSSNLFNRAVAVEHEEFASDLFGHIRHLVGHLTWRGYSEAFVMKNANLHPIAANHLLSSL